MPKSRHVGFEGGLKVNTSRKQMCKDFKNAKKWIKSVKSFVVDKENYSKKEIECFYGCTFKVPTSQEDLSEYVVDAEFATSLPYEERLNYEITKMTINAFVRYKSFIIGDRVPSETMPDCVKSMLAEIVKIKMLVEYEIHGDDKIKNTIPEIDSTKVDPKVVQNEIEQLKLQIDEDVDYDLDSILDKISMYGIESITKKEMEFLNQQSKNN